MQATRNLAKAKQSLNFKPATDMNGSLSKKKRYQSNAHEKGLPLPT
jgi:hypothetical protein